MTAQDSGLADMQDMPVSATWYHYLRYLRDVIRRLEAQHASALRAGAKRTPREVEQDGTAQLHARIAVDQIDRYMRTMEAANVLSPKP